MICVIQGGTLIKCAKLLRENGVNSVICCVTHGILSGPAIERLNATEYIDKMIVTNTLDQSENLKKCNKIEIVDISNLLAKIMKCILSGDSISNFFRLIE